MAREVELKEPVKRLLAGLDKAADTIGGTLGPRGRNVLYEYPPFFKITNDGKSIADALDFADPYEKAGAWIIKNAAAQTNDDAGDGTTSTTVLLQAIVHEALKRPENAMEVSQSLKDALPGVIRAIKAKSRPVENVKQVALISAEDEVLASKVAEVVEQVGEKGTILVEENLNPHIEYEVVNGYEAWVGFMSPHFINIPAKAQAEYKDVAVFCTQRKINNVGDITPLFQHLKEQNVRQIVIVCEDIDPQMLGVFVQNKMAGLFNTLVIRATGPLLEDIASAVGARLVSEATGVTFENFQTEYLGKAEKVVSGEKKTVFLSKAKTAKQQAERLEEFARTNPSKWEAKKARERAAKLQTGIAILRVGSPTTVDMGYLKDKADDAVHATQAALEEGVVEGGGLCLWRVAQEMKPNTIGNKILKKALQAPFRKICDNAGVDYTEVVTRLPAGKGYDAKTGIAVDMHEYGIIDPAKVERCAVTNALLNAAQLISTHAAIVDLPAKTDTK